MPHFELTKNVRCLGSVEGSRSLGSPVSEQKDGSTAVEVAGASACALFPRVSLLSK